MTTKRQTGLEYQWYGSGITPEQRKGVESLVKALQYYAAHPDPKIAGLARLTLKNEGMRRPNHAALGGHVPPMPGVKRPPGMPR